MEHLLSTWGYAALFVATFLSSMCIPVGSEIAMGYSGALASGQLTGPHDQLNLGAVIVVAIAGEVVGSNAGYAIGRFGGRPLLDRIGRYILLTQRDLDRAEEWFARRGDAFVFFGRLVPLLRSFVSLAAGLGEMTIVKFEVFTVLGSGVFVAALVSIGYSLGASWHHVIKAFSYAGYVAAALAVIAIAIVIVHRIVTLRSERGRHVAGTTTRHQAASGPPPSGPRPVGGGADHTPAP